jgi:regulator of protease activity HflC (stomatin/prohibitin superfamily)
MDASIYFRIDDVCKAKYRIDDYLKGLRIMGISSLRVVGAMFTLQQFLEERE